MCSKPHLYELRVPDTHNDAVVRAVRVHAVHGRISHVGVGDVALTRRQDLGRRLLQSAVQGTCKHDKDLR